MRPALAVFLQAPRLGVVKPRLGEEIGARHALRLYRVLAGRTLAVVREAGLDPTVWFAPADAGAEMRFWLGDAWDLRPQASGDLGARLAAAEQAADRGRGWLVVGADCPRLSAALLREAVGADRAGRDRARSQRDRRLLSARRTDAAPAGVPRALVGNERRARGLAGAARASGRRVA